MPRPNYIFFRHTLRSQIESYITSVLLHLAEEDVAIIVMKHRFPRRMRFLSIVHGVLRWLYLCLPFVWIDRRGRTGESYRFLTFQLNLVRGPHTCFFCQRATMCGADLTRGDPACCGPCFAAGRLDEKVAA